MSWHSLPTKVATEDFDYVTNDEERYSPRFVEYLGSWYDVNEFEPIGAYRDFTVLYQWHGIQTDSSFSGVLIKYSDDYDSVTIGRYYV